MAAHHDPPPSADTPPQPQPRRLRGVLLTALSLLVAFAVIVGERFVVREFGWIGIVGYAVGALVLLLVAIGIRRGKQLRARGANAVLANTDRPPVLYLRPFGADGGEFVRGKLETLSYEQILARELNKVGPVIAIGSPHEDPRLPELGAARMYVPDLTWQERVDGLIRDASLVVLHAGGSAGLIWELQRVVGWNRPEGLIICLPIDPAHTARKRRTAEARYAEFRAATSHIFPRPLPANAEGCAFIYFMIDWQPELLRFGRPPVVRLPAQSIALKRLSKRFRHLVARP